MPLSPKQRRAIESGYAACMSCGDKLAQLRRLGYPNEAAEIRQQADQKVFEESFKIMAEFDANKSKGKTNG